ncbi:transcription repressor NadR [Athalassotoga sp.]|uniref:transcription repressor NadR n=1 Tax=Athalassotoga sp. TaxID=2022597 RepID=UPI003D048EA3
MPMRKEERRRKILDLLSKSDLEISGDQLAKVLGVTRQIIVQDIGVLRSMNYNIISLARGYKLIKKNDGIKRIIVVKHSKEKIKEELMCVVQNGGRVLDVIVEHPVYGELKGNINVSNEDEVEKFIGMIETSSAMPLLSLSNGVHLHTIEAKDEETIKRIISILDKKKFILK